MPGCPTEVEQDARISCRRVPDARAVPSMIEDVRRGLMTRPLSLPPKYFYDERGSRLFDRICDTPEYYVTRTEDALLRDSARQIVEVAKADDILELGSGMSRKTRRLLDACASLARPPTYSPFDISTEALIEAANGLVRDYPWLEVNVLVGDYEAGLGNLPRAAGCRLVCFLGSTIGNFEPAHAVAFLSELRRRMAPGDTLLLGADRVKDKAVLEAAYNDADGLTAAFNLNVLSVINATLDAEFDLDGFVHDARFNEDESRIEMRLIARRAQRVRVGALGETLAIAADEAILTEISRKFTERSLTDLLHAAGFGPVAHFTPDNRYFSLIMARPEPD